MTKKLSNKLAWNRTKKGLCFNIYNDQKANSKTRRHRPPEYSRDELKEWLMSQTLFHELHNEWEQSGYKRGLRPSVDRKHDDIHYCFNNIQLMTLRENETKFFISMVKCEVIHKVNPQRRVNQYDKEMNLIAEYNSMMEASRATGLSQGNIWGVCNEARKTTGGYIWRYIDED